MVSGIDLLVLRPDEELKRLARLALELDVAGSVEGAADEEALRAALAGSDPGAKWLADFDETKNPWFCFSNGNGLYHHHRSWIDDTRLPIAAIGAYVRRLEAGEDISRPYDAVLAERERIPESTARCCAEDMRQLFDERPGARAHRLPLDREPQLLRRAPLLHALLEQAREFGALLAGQGFLGEQEDVFYLRHDEVREALEELRMYWSSDGAGAPEALGTGRRLWHAAGRSTRRCASGCRLWFSVRFPRRSPIRSRSCSGGSRTSAFRGGSRPGGCRPADPDRVCGLLGCGRGQEPT